MSDRLARASLVLALALPAAAGAGNTPFASSGRLGLGIGGGTLANGISGKLYLSDTVAAQALLGWWRQGGFSFGVDGVVEMPPLYSHRQFGINWNAGAGAAVGFFRRSVITSTMIGVAGVLGLGFQIKELPIELTFEFRPTLLLGDAYWSDFYWGGGGAIRWFFE